MVEGAILQDRKLNKKICPGGFTSEHPLIPLICTVSNFVKELSSGFGVIR